MLTRAPELLLCAASKGRPEQIVQVETAKTGRNCKAKTSPGTAKHMMALVQHECHLVKTAI